MKKLFVLEIIATVLYAGSVFLFGFSPDASPVIFQTAWILSCIACPLYVFYFYKKRLYSDMAEMGLYIPLNVIGLLGIFFYSQNFTPPEISTLNVSLISAAIIAVGTVAMRYGVKALNEKFPKVFPTPASPWLDAGTTVASLVATALLILWFPATWIIWIAVDALAVYIYFKNRSYIVAISYVLYFLNAIRGVINWG